MSLLPLDAWKRLSPLLDELLELPPAARAQRLLELRDSGGASLVDELEALLDAGAQADAEGFLVGSALDRARLAKRRPE